MTLMLSKTYDALLAAGAPEEKARDAAEELAGYESDIGELKSDVRLLKWMVGSNFVATLAVLVRVFFH